VDPRADLDDLEKRRFLTLPGLELLGDVGVNLSIILKWTAEKWDVTLWGESSWLRLGHIVVTCELGIMTLGIP
jgi:hypothetical protein